VPLPDLISVPDSQTYRILRRGAFVDVGQVSVGKRWTSPVKGNAQDFDLLLERGEKLEVYGEPSSDGRRLEGMEGG